MFRPLLLLIVLCLPALSLACSKKKDKTAAILDSSSTKGRLFPPPNLPSCKNDEGQDVDWFLAYKLPKERTHSHPLVKQGYAYAVLTPKTLDKGWRISAHKVTDPLSMFSKTLEQKDMARVLMIGYNDQPPDQSQHSSQAHAKGFVLVNADSGLGLWMSHSAPGFPPLSEGSAYSYPETATVYGQTLLCLTLSKLSMDELGKHLQTLKPHVYFSGPLELVPVLSGKGKLPYLVRLASKKAGTGVSRNASAVRSHDLQTRGGLQVMTFGKRALPEQDLYSATMAPALKTSLRVQSWLRSAGNCLPKLKSGKYYAQSIRRVGVQASDSKTGWGFNKGLVTLDFRTTRDHSKWAVSVDPDQPWTCIADVNRKDTQTRRAGGAACLRQREIWKVYNTTWLEMEPTTGGDAKTNCPLPDARN